MTSNQYVKKFTINDFLHSYKCQSVKREFHKLNNKNQKRRDARLTLINKFSGNFVKGYEYMKSNPFKKK